MHKPLVVLLALGRLARNEPPLVEFAKVDQPLQELLRQFGPQSAPATRHYPFWHLATDKIWQLKGPVEILNRPPGATPTLTELRSNHIAGGFSDRVLRVLRNDPNLVAEIARRILAAHFPETLPIPLDQALIAQARAALGRVPLAARVYARIKLSALSRQVPEFRVADAAGRDAAVAFARNSGEPLTKGVPGLYTVKGYRQAFQPQVSLVAADLLKEGWVVGSEGLATLDAQKARQYETDVRELYFKDYVKHWEGLLADLDVVGFTSLRQGVDVLAVLVRAAQARCLAQGDRVEWPFIQHGFVDCFGLLRQPALLVERQDSFDFRYATYLCLSYNMTEDLRVARFSLARG